MNKHIYTTVLILLGIFPQVSFSQEESNDVIKKNSTFGTFRPIDSVSSSRHNKNSCDSVNGDVEKIYCQENLTLYKPRIDFSTKKHKFRWNYREEKLSYIYGETESIDYLINEKTIVFKHKILFDF